MSKIKFIDAIDEVIFNIEEEFPISILDDFEDDFFDKLGYLVEFLDIIPDENIYEEAENFLLLCHKYVLEIRDEKFRHKEKVLFKLYNEIKNKFLTFSKIKSKPIKSQKKPSLKIKDDLKTIKNFKSLLESTPFIKNIAFTKNKEFVGLGSNDIQNFNDLKAIYDFIIKIENELITKKFDLIDENRYYKRKPSTQKKDISDFLYSLVNKYSIKNAKQYIKPLVTQIK